jgi:predicted dehydrogenase
MTPTLTIGLIGDGPAAAAYSTVAPEIAGLSLVSAAPDALLADPNIYGVIVACPPTARTRNARAALEQGKQVLAAAPAAGSPEELDELQRTANAAGVSLMVSQPWRFHEVYRSFRAALDAGDLGPPAFFHWVSEGNPDWPEAGPTAATGATVGIDLALWLLDDVPARVYARSVGSDGVTLSLRFRGGANALIEYRARLPAAGARFGSAWLLGSRGEVRWDQAADGLAVSDGAAWPPLDFRACLADQVRHAIACWRGTIDPGHGPDTARWLQAVTAAANESVRHGRPVTIVAVGEGRGQ